MKTYDEPEYEKQIPHSSVHVESKRKETVQCGAAAIKTPSQTVIDQNWDKLRNQQGRSVK